jgi:hypothetical protein
MFMHNALQILALSDADRLEQWRKFSDIDRKIYVVSKWAGVGTSHVCLKHAALAMDAIGISLPFEHYAAFDLDQTCKDVLGRIGCGHVFGDVSAGSCSDWMQRLRDIGDELMGSWVASEICGAPPTDLRALLHSLNDKYMTWILDNSHEYEFDLDAVAPCMACGEGAECRVCPPKDGEVLEFISPTCISWSIRGNQMGWLCKSNRPLIAWCLQSNFSLPTMAVVECTPALDVRYMQRLMPCFDLTPVIMSPDLVGFPVGGERVFIRCLRRSVPRTSLVYEYETFHKFFFRELMLTQNVFLLCSDAELMQYLNFLGHQKHKVPKVFERLPRTAESRKAVLTAQERVRLQHHESRAEKFRREASANLGITSSDERGANMFIFNITQNIDHHKGASPICPRPLRSCVLWSELRKSPLTPKELFAIHGISLKHTDASAC